MKNLLTGLIFITCQGVYAQVDIIKIGKEEPGERYGSYEQTAEFKGGVEALLTFLKATIQLPKEALDNGIMGIVFVSFAVTETGDVSDIKILKGLGYGCDEEVIRVVKLMKGRWTPEIKGNKPVKSTFTIPVLFK